MLEINFLNVLYIGNDHLSDQSFRGVFGTCEFATNFDSQIKLSEAYQALESTVYQLIFCDFNLPDGNAIDFLESKKFCDIPVIVFTSEGDDPSKANKVIKKGAFNCIEKDDFTATELAPIIDKILDSNSIREEQSKEVLVAPIITTSDGNNDSSNKFKDLNLKVLVELADGDGLFIETLFETYIKNTQVDIIKYEQAIVDDDVAIQNGIAHKLRSSFEIFHFDALHELSLRMENHSTSDEERLNFFELLKKSPSILQEKLDKFRE